MPCSAGQNGIVGGEWSSVVSGQRSISLSTDPTVCSMGGSELHRLCIHQRLDNLFRFHIVNFFVTKINVKLTASTNIDTMPIFNRGSGILI